MKQVSYKDVMKNKRLTDFAATKNCAVYNYHRPLGERVAKPRYLTHMEAKSKQTNLSFWAWHLPLRS